jgi:TfoX/Sxy family transcriptional regulator of competence genes
MTDITISRAMALLDEASEMLHDITSRKMFGCYALFAREAIYSLVWPPGRIGLRLSTPELYNELLALPGAEPWRFEPEGKPVKHWVLIPVDFHNDMDLLEKWVKLAYDCAIEESAKPKKARKKGKKLADLKL